MHNNTFFNTKLKILYILCMIYFTVNIVGIPLAYKLIIVGPFIGPGGLVVLPIVFLVEDIIVELYGYKVSRFILWMVMASTIIFTLMTLWIIHLPSPEYWGLQESYDTVFGPLKKSVPSALLGILVGRFINIILMSKWRIITNGRYFFLRSIFATFIGSCCALAVFFLLSFSSFVPHHVLKILFFSDLSIRMLYSFIGGIPVTFLVRYLKIRFGFDVYEEGLSFNPFSLDTKFIQIKEF